MVMEDYGGIEDYSPTLLHMISSHTTIGDAIRGANHVYALFIHRLELILQSDRVDINSLNQHNETPLDALILHSYSSFMVNRRTFSYDNLDVRIAKAFLDAGASESASSTIPEHSNYLGGFHTNHREQMRALFNATDEPGRWEAITKLRRRKRMRYDAMKNEFLR